MAGTGRGLSDTSENSYVSVLIEMEGCFDEDEEMGAPAGGEVNMKNKSDFPGASVSPVDLEELEKFAKRFKDRRTALGYTQGDVGLNVGRFYGHDFSQTTVSRFEALNLSFKNMCKLKPILENWLRDAEAGRLPNPSREGAKPVWEDDMERSLPAPLPVVSSKRRRRRRTSIGHSSLIQLEKLFGSNRKPSGVDLEIIGEKLGLEKEVVRVWFCNRRQKYKRDTKHGGSASNAFGDPDASDDDAVDGGASSGTPLSTSDTASANDPGPRGAKRRKSGLLLHFDEPGSALPATVTFPMDAGNSERCCRNEASSSKCDGDHGRVSNFVENTRSDQRRFTRSGDSASEAGSEDSIVQRIIAKNSSSVESDSVFVASTGARRGGVGIFGGRKKIARRGCRKSRVGLSISKVLEGSESRLAVPGSISMGDNCGDNSRWLNSDSLDSATVCCNDPVARAQLLSALQSTCGGNDDVYANDKINDFMNSPHFPTNDQLTSVSLADSAATCLESAVQQLLNSSGENGLLLDRSCSAEISLPRHWSESRLAEMGVEGLGKISPYKDVCGTLTANGGPSISWDNNVVHADIPQLEELLPDALSREVLANEGFDQADTNSGAETSGGADRDIVPSESAVNFENGDNGGASSGLVFDLNGFPIVLTLTNGSKFLLIRRGSDSVFPIALESLSAIVQGSDQHIVPPPDVAGSGVAGCAEICSNAADCVNNNDSEDADLSPDLTSTENLRRPASPETQRRPASNDGIPVFSGSMFDGAPEKIDPPDSLIEGDHGKSAGTVDDCGESRRTVILLKRLIPDSDHDNSTNAFLSNKMPNVEQGSGAGDQTFGIDDRSSTPGPTCLEHPAPDDFGVDGVGRGLPQSLTRKSENSLGVNCNILTNQLLTSTMSPGLDAVPQESNGYLQDISKNSVTESVLKSISPANETKLIVESGSSSFCSDTKPSMANDCQLNCELIPSSSSESMTTADLLLEIGNRRKRDFDIDDINSSTEDWGDGVHALLNDRNRKFQVIGQLETDAGEDYK